VHGRIEVVAYAHTFVETVAPWLDHFAEACAVLVVLYGVARALLAF
jgi:hypothetical protein